VATTLKLKSGRRKKMKNKRIFIVIFIVLVAIFSARSHNKPVGVTSPQVAKPTQLLFVGDIMLDRDVRLAIQKNGFEYLFADIKNIFGNLDLAVGNLEGTITSKPSISLEDYSKLKFTFDPSVVKSLKDLGFNGFSQANNHALDFGTDGFLSTQANLSSADLFSFGSPSNDINLSHMIAVNGENICFVGYHALYKEDTTPIVNEIKKVNQECSFVIVFAHWGMEYEVGESADQVREAHDFIDAGADLVLGAHPHVIEPIEIYKGKAIFYSLGNFVFDQDFSLATRQGLAVRLELGTSTETFHLIGLEMQNSKLYFPEKEAFQIRTNILISQLPKDLAQTADIDGVLILSR
jgi:poly-gamma-glutamate synthesis protein (capsule biosynthesis protein)